MQKPPNSLLIKFGEMFEASATGNFAIVALVVVVVLYLAFKHLV